MRRQLTPAMSPARTPNPDPDAEAHPRRCATTKARKLLREGMARLEAVLDDRFIINETPLEASTAMELAIDAIHAGLHQLNAADSVGGPGARAPAGAPTRQQGQFLAYIASTLKPIGLVWRQAMPICRDSSTSRRRR